MKAKVNKTKKAYQRHPQNPFRIGAYSRTLDIAIAKKGIRRQKLIELASKVNRKSIKLTTYDVQVVLSPKNASPTCERHKSCRDGYGVEHLCDGMTKIVLPQIKKGKG